VLSPLSLIEREKTTTGFGKIRPRTKMPEFVQQLQLFYILPYVLRMVLHMSRPHIKIRPPSYGAVNTLYVSYIYRSLLSSTAAWDLRFPLLLPEF
jgi:hypothetical protein